MVAGKGKQWQSHVGEDGDWPGSGRVMVVGTLGRTGTDLTVVESWWWGRWNSGRVMVAGTGKQWRSHDGGNGETVGESWWRERENSGRVMVAGTGKQWESHGGGDGETVAESWWRGRGPVVYRHGGKCGETVAESWWRGGGNSDRVMVAGRGKQWQSHGGGDEKSTISGSMTSTLNCQCQTVSFVWEWSQSIVACLVATQVGRWLLVWLLVCLRLCRAPAGQDRKARRTNKLYLDRNLHEYFLSSHLHRITANSMPPAQSCSHCGPGANLCESQFSLEFTLLTLEK